MEVMQAHPSLLPLPFKAPEAFPVRIRPRYYYLGTSGQVFLCPVEDKVLFIKFLERKGS